jgi:hypothetical protein
MTNTFGHIIHAPELKVIKLSPKGKCLLLFGQPRNPKVAERGIQKGECNLEKPVGDDQAEDKRSGEFWCCPIKCNKHENYGVDELAGDGAEVVSQPKQLSVAHFLE